MGGRAFRAPSIYEEYYSDGGLTSLPGNDPQRGTTLKPESVYSGEVEISQRFKEDWVGLAAVHTSYVENLINTAPVPNSSTGLITYANSLYPALAAGGDLELRREWRQGWMLSAYYSYEHASYYNSNLLNAELVNSPQHLAAFKGVVPVLPDLISLALRVTLEAPRRISASSDATTPTALVGDLVASGNLKKFGIGYRLGVYNVADTKYVYPVSSSYLNSVFQQSGRSFLGDITVAYP